MSGGTRTPADAAGSAIVTERRRGDSSRTRRTVIVLDASALVELILDTPTGELVASRIADPAKRPARAASCGYRSGARTAAVCPRGEIDAARAAAALDDLRALDLPRHPHEPFLEHVWALRQNLTACDAVYVALTEVLDGVLVTCDRPLSRMPALEGRVELLQAERGRR